MEGKGLRELVKRVFSDEATRREFTDDPETVMSRFSLSGPEKKAVLATHMRLGLVTAGPQGLEASTDPTSFWS